MDLPWEKVDAKRAAEILRPWAAALEGRISDPVLQRYIKALLEDLAAGINENLIPAEERWERGNRWTAEALVDSIAWAYRRAVEPAVPPAPAFAPGPSIGLITENWIRQQIMLDLRYGPGRGGDGAGLL